jgi:ketosteroid isomerase-like protein
MASVAQQNLETVVIDFFGALRRGDSEAAARLLDPDVTWWRGSCAAWRREAAA